MKGWQLLIGACALVAAQVSARAETTVYDLPACIRAALANSPDLAAAAADLAAAAARVSEARAARFGQMEYTQILGVANRARGNPTSSPDNKNDLFDGLGPFTRIDVSINLPLWTFGKLDAALRAASDALESDRADADGRRGEVVFATKQLYYSLLLTRQLAAVLKQMLEGLDEALAKTQRRMDADDPGVTEVNVLELRIGRARAAKGLYEVEASAQLARRALARAVDVPPDRDFDIADRKLTPVGAQVQPLEVYLAEGPQRRPETRRLRSGIEAQSAKVDLEKAGYYPDLFLGTGLQFARAGNRTEQDNPFASDDFNYLRPVGVIGARWNLNFLSTSARVEQARAELQRLEARRREAASGLDLDIRRAYAELEQARDTMRAAEDGHKAGRSLMILTVSNFDLGIGDAAELFRGLGSYTEASTDHLRAVHDYNVAVAALGRAVGREVADLRY